MVRIEILSRDSIKKLVSGLRFPSSGSHKGENGRALVIGGSSLFHSAQFWAAEIASHFVDIVHYASTEENNIIFRQTKKRFHNGIVVSRRDIDAYLHEDDVVLTGPGMMRNETRSVLDRNDHMHFHDVLRFRTEPEFTQAITKYILSIKTGINKVFDAGALQMMDKEWLMDQPKARVNTIITPHQLEFARLFGLQLTDLNFKKKIETAENIAQRYGIVILLKAVDDIVTDGKSTFVIKGGNAGLTKGGTGDILAGLVTSFFARNAALTSAVAASVLLKKTADCLYETKGYWYNNDDILENLPQVLKNAL